MTDAPTQSGICDNLRPRYAVDLQVLAENGDPDPNLPILAGVPLPVSVGDNEIGFFAFPQEGTIVVVNFAYGMPSKPFIQTILHLGQSLSKLPKGDQSGSTAKPPSSAWTPTVTGRGRPLAAYRTFQLTAKSSPWTTRSIIKATAQPWTTTQKRQSAGSKLLKPWAL